MNNRWNTMLELLIILGTILLVSFQKMMSFLYDNQTKRDIIVSVIAVIMWLSFLYNIFFDIAYVVNLFGVIQLAISSFIIAFMLWHYSNNSVHAICRMVTVSTILMNISVWIAYSNEMSLNLSVLLPNIMG